MRVRAGSCFAFLCLAVLGSGSGLAATSRSHLAPVATGATIQDTTPAGAREAKQAEKKKKPLPLEPGRELAFSTAEGTWMSIDVSPDGTTLVFDLMGDLYTLPIEGGQARRLTHGMAFDGQPRFSPDGSRIVFVSDRSGAENLWIMSLDGKDTVQVTKGKDNLYQSPEWTPDGHYIVASKSGGLGAAKPWIFHVEGGSGLALVKKPRDLRLTGAAFGPDPRYIWFARRDRTWQYNAIFPQYELAVYDRDTGKLHARSSRYGSALRPTLSPDGHWLAFATRYEADTGLRIRDLRTGEERWLAYPVQHDDQESVASRDAYPGMAFTPDSKELVTTYGGRIWRVPVDGGPAIEVPFSADVKLALGPELDFDYSIPDTPKFTVRQIRDAVPSPDGTRLAFTALDRLYVMDYPDGTPRRLTDMEVTEAEPTWSPDGRWVAYATWSPDGGNLYRVRADGRRRPERLTETPAVYQQPAWSPDGLRIVAIRGPARAYRANQGPRLPGATQDLVWIPATGGVAVVIAPTDGRSHPHFTRDSGRIYLYSSTDGLVSLRFDGTDEKHHLKVTGKKLPGAEKPMRASEVLISPDGTQALAQVNNDLYVVTVPYVGGETPTISVADPKAAAFPARKLTKVGGQFPAWAASGPLVHWSIGNAHFVYDLDAAKSAEDSVKAAKRAEEAAEGQKGKEAAGGAEGGGRAAEVGQETPQEKKEEKPAYEPRQTRIRIQAERDIPRGTVVLRGARAITMRGDEVIEDADVVIRDNRIAAIGPRGGVTVPEGARVIDVSGKTILPGYVDTHAHIWPAWGIHKTQVAGYLANLAYGVTTTRDPQTSTTDVLTYSDRVEAGRMLGPRIYSTGPGVFRSEAISSLDEARDILKRYSEYYDTKTIKMYMTGNRQQRQWVIMAAREQKLMPTTEGGLDLKLDMTQVIDGYPGHEHSLPIFPLYNDVVRLMAESRSVYTPTFIVSYGGPFGEEYFYSRENPHDDPKLRRFTPHEEIDHKTRRRGSVGPGPGGWFRDEEFAFSREAAQLKKIVDAGGRAGVGSHGQLQGLGYHWELRMLASGGLSPRQVLRLATLVGADAIGLDGDIGSLEPGKLADLQVLDANPLEDIRNTNSIRYVMKNGRLYDGDTLDEVWPRERKLEGLYWWGGEPDGVKAGIRK
ncbi:MAG: amidohydrolase family protein [Gemmatimonadota bacterium]